jgi:hypothetical protein
MSSSSLFTGLQQLDIDIAGALGKTPTFYRDGRSIAATFPARLSVLRNLMPCDDYTPARLAPGVGVINVDCFEHRVSDIGPYNEVAISVLLRPLPTGRRRPTWVPLAARASHQDAYIWKLPVTTEIARAGGFDHYGFPTFLAHIDFDSTGDHISCRVVDHGTGILTLTGPPLAPTHERRVDTWCRLWMDGEPQAARFRRHQIELARCSRFGAATLELDRRHPMGHDLGHILLSRRSISYESCPRFEAVLFGPDHLTLPAIARTLHPAEFPPAHHEAARLLARSSG